MKIIVFGGTGKIGTAAAWDLSKQDSVEKIGLVGRRKGALEEFARTLPEGKAEIHAIDILSRKEIAAAMKGYDVGIIAMPDRRTSYRLAETAIQEGLHIVDMLEEYHRRPDADETEGLELPEDMTLDKYGDYLHETAIKNDVMFLDGIGFAPGLSNITVGEAIRRLDVADTAVARVGGIPDKMSASNHPLKYMITWAFRHVLREYMIKVKILSGGKIVDVDATTGREKFVFSKLGVPDEALECAITPGMPSFIYSRPGLREFAEKTIRWPGHWSSIDTLKECGLLGITPVHYDGQTVIPREFILQLIEPKLRANENESDVCVMWNTITGTKNGKPAQFDYYMWEEADKNNDISAMARVTGYPASIGAMFIHKYRNGRNGIIPPEDFFVDKIYSEFMEELRKRNIHILEECNIETIEEVNL